MQSKNLSGSSFNFRMTPDERRTVDSMAQRAGVSRGDVLRALVRAAEAKQLTIALIPRQQVAQHANQ